MRTFLYGMALFAAAQMATIVAPKAEMQHYKATLTGPAETPPTDSKGTGALTATFDTDTKKLEWTATYSGLTGPAIAAHFHGPAPVGKAAPIEVPLQPPLDSPMKGSAT
jgi:CHRD domain